MKVLSCFVLFVKMNWAFEVPVQESILNKRQFICAHKTERLICIEHENMKDSYMLHFSKRAMSVRFSRFLCERNVLVRTFNLVLLYLISKFLNKDDISNNTFLNYLFDSLDLSELNDEVNCVLRMSNSNRLFQTLKYHFSHTYGNLRKIKEGFVQYPPQNKLFYAPSLSIEKYKCKYPILFYNNMHTIPVDFRTYDFDQYTTVLNPTPIYNRKRNMIIRDYHTNVCKIQPLFRYLRAGMAKLSTAETNNVKDYMFLLFINNRYYEVLAIYPKDMIQKIKPKLQIGNRNFCHNNLVFIDTLTKLKSTSEQESKSLRSFFLNNVQDQVTYDKVKIHLSEWLTNVVTKYINTLEMINDVPPYRLDLKNMSTGDLKVWMHSTGLQFVLMFESVAFVFTTLHSGVSSENDIYCYFDSECNLDETLKMIHFTAILRCLLHLIYSTQPQLVISWSERQLNIQMLYFETKDLKHLVNANSLAKMVSE